ncbi:hypothetical protein JD276_06705 [Leucobacter sp. CSA1]|uniref:Lipoprotein n=1 Tax=Leucobacter chromiisoli TaxID=2796471 RepID=A0A934Q5E2_9MICO|nr:hypothetical protein [Leucobacter chromiisoli]MBK0418725.1 hypothetical protein [Leucobacter chromiisoli]
MDQGTVARRTLAFTPILLLLGGCSVAPAPDVEPAERDAGAAQESLDTTSPETRVEPRGEFPEGPAPAPWQPGDPAPASIPQRLFEESDVDPASLHRVGHASGVEVWAATRAVDGSPCGIWVPTGGYGTAFRCQDADDFAAHGMGLVGNLRDETRGEYSVDVYLLPEDARAGGMEISGFHSVGERLLIRRAPAVTSRIEVPVRDGSRTIVVQVMG